MARQILRFLKSLFLALLLTVFPPLFAAENVSAPISEQPDENNLRLLNVHVGPHIFADLVDAYTYGNITLIPVGALSNMVDLAITVEPEKGVARGFLYDERKTFFLDLSRNEVILSGKQFIVSREQIKIYPGDIYIDANLLSQWLPFKLDVDLFSSLLKIRSDKKLPFEEKLDRQRRYNEVQARIAGRKEAQYPSYFEPYSNAEPPFVTATVQASATQNEQTSQSTTSANYAIHGTGDLFKMESVFYLAGTNQNPGEQLRATLGRKDRDGRLLGGLHATEFAFGHINTPSSQLISRPALPQLGAMVSNYDLAQQGEYDRHSFRGELQAGWEVELYHNNALIGYQSKSTNGQYLFSNVPLFFGRNYFRLVFFGPQGQKREEVYNFDLENSLAKKGKHYYRVQSSTDSDGGYHNGIQYDYGFANNFSMSTEYQGLTLGSDRLLGGSPQSRNYTRFGLRGLLAGMFLSGDSVTDSSGGTAVELGASTRLGVDTLISLKGAQLTNGFVSDSYPLSVDPLRQQVEASLNTAIPSSFLPRLPIGFRYQNNAYGSGSTRSQLDSRISLSYSRLAISNNISVVNSTSQSDQITGQLQLSGRTRHFNIRSDLGYSLQPISNSTSVSLTVDNIRSGKGLYSFGIFQQLQNPVTQYSANYNRPAGKIAFNVGASYNTAGNRTFSFGLTTGISREPRTPYWVVDSKPVSGTGAVSARVFLDTNQDGIYSDGDKVLPGIQFNNNGNQLPVKSDENGIAFITGLTSHAPSDISIATGTLEDPLWKPAVEGVRLSPRPGSVAKIDFPVVESGEVDGSIYILRNGKLGGVGDVEIQLVNAEGKIIRATKSAYDGFYLFSGLNHGTYLLRVSPDQIRNLNLFEVRPIQITVDRNNQFVSGINFRLERK